MKVVNRIIMSMIMSLVLIKGSLAEQVDYLQDISVTISSGSAQGSGTLYTRKIGDDNITFVWTAAHVLSNLRKTREIIDVKTGTTRKVVEFEDAQIIREFTDKGRRIGETKFDAKVILYSDSETGEDLAILMIRKPDYTDKSVKFYLDEKIPTIGTELYHVGSLQGQIGANSLTTGIISQIGRVLDLNADGTVFDQTTVTAFPGSSGGGVFLKSDFRYVGMLVRGGGEQFNFIVPARRIIRWAKEAKVEWAVNPEVPAPSLDEINKMKPEYIGVTFEKSEKALDKNTQDKNTQDKNTKDKNAQELNIKFPFLIETVK